MFQLYKMIRHAVEILHNMNTYNKYGYIRSTARYLIYVIGRHQSVANVILTIMRLKLPALIDDVNKLPYKKSRIYLAPGIIFW